MKPARPTLLVLLAALSVGACDQGGGSLRGDWLLAVDCARLGEATRFEPFELDLEFASVVQHSGAALMRMSPFARLIDRADQLAITLDAGADVAEQIRSTGASTLVLRGDGQGDAHLSVMLLGRCEHTTQALEAEGTITFFDYGWKTRSRVRGEMAFDLVDRRTGEIVGQNFVGDFDFESLANSPLTTFAPRDY